ncbi:hypothetical protein LCGC14_1570940 [marine sediment metagenome]|uniref:Uncharacterized protein n=1 Tax=marine sediment metagenome TaxID=412755 RepID=A0A0F9J5X9_9ZZZZ
MARPKPDDIREEMKRIFDVKPHALSLYKDDRRFLLWRELDTAYWTLDWVLGQTKVRPLAGIFNDLDHKDRKRLVKIMGQSKRKKP